MSSSITEGIADYLLFKRECGGYHVFHSGSAATRRIPQEFKLLGANLATIALAPAPICQERDEGGRVGAALECRRYGGRSRGCGQIWGISGPEGMRISAECR